MEKKSCFVVVGQAMPDNASQEAYILCQRRVSPDLQTTKSVNPRQAKPDLHKKQGGGFTLIELLVVVLIIGILAAVALPQYKVAVEKARLMNLVTLMKPLKEAQETYYLTNGTYSDDFESLDVGQDITNNTKSIWRRNGYMFELSLSSPARMTGHDSNLKNIEVIVGYNNTHWKGKWACYALNTDDRANKLCQSVAHKKTRDGTGAAMGGVANIYYFIQ